MKKEILLLFSACLFVIVGYAAHAHAALKTMQADEKIAMEKHMEQVKVSAPQRFQEMIKRAGGSATKCTDCHVEVLKAKQPGR